MVIGSSEIGRPRRWIVWGLVGTLLVVVAAGLLWSALADHDAEDDQAITNSVFDADGNLAMPMPRLADGFELTPQDDGSTLVKFGVELGVYNAKSEPVSPGAKADAAVVHVNVNATMTPAGPLRLAPVWSDVQFDQGLDATQLTRSYSVRLPPATTQFLNSKGLNSTDPTQHQQALQYIDVAVQHIRDFKVVDGKWDWQQGRAWTAADQPVQESITNYSTVSVTNNTGAGLYDISDPEADPNATEDPSLIETTSEFATNISLSGQPVQCISQGNGSDPQGFSLLNGWDIEDNLPPGILPPGATITEQVNVDDSLGNSGLGIAEDATAVALDVGIAALGWTTPGVESAVTATAMLAMGVSELSEAATLATGVPIGAILELGYELYNEIENSCANYANVVNITAAEPSGSSASYSWGDQTNGLWQVYDTATSEGTPVTTNVALSPSTGIVSFNDPDTNLPSTVNPWLTQVPTVACGAKCPSGTNNVIDVNWSVSNPCPQADLSNCLPTPSDLSTLPAIDVPGTDLCGPNNSLCPPLAAPVPSESEVGGLDTDPCGPDNSLCPGLTAPIPSESGASGLKNENYNGPAYAVMKQMTPPTPINAIAVSESEIPYAGGPDGNLYRVTTTGAFENMGNPGKGDILSMVASDETIYFGTDLGDLVQYENGDFTSLGSVTGGITKMTKAGDALYMGTNANELWFYGFGNDSPNQVVADFSAVNPQAGKQTITSLAVNDNSLFVGFENGVIEQCALTDCPQSWSQLHDNGFNASANALTTVGDTLYVGLSTGAIAQINSQNSNVLMMQNSGIDDNTIAGLTVVNGNVYVGGCLSTINPATTDLLGVAVLVGTNPEIDEPGFPAGELNPLSDTNTCYNWNSTDSKYKGFDTSQYAIASSSTESTADDPAVIYQAFTINSGSFFYILENLQPYNADSGLCLGGDCPAAPPQPAVPPGPPPPVGAVSAIGDPQVESNCDLTDAQTDGANYNYSEAAGPGLGTIQPSGTITSDGFQLRAPSSADGPCTTTFAWNMNNVGSYPYSTWSGNAYLDADDTPGVQLSLDVNGASGQDIAFTANGAVPADAANVGPGGVQLTVPLNGVNALVFTMVTQAGSPPAVINISNDSLTPLGQAPAPSTPLIAPSEPCTYPRAALASHATVLYKLNDATLVAEDASGHDNNGTITEPAALDVQPGPNAVCPGDGALQFNGTSTQVTAPYGVSDGTTGEAITVVSWMKVSETPSGNPRIIANDHTDETNKGFQLMVQSDGDGVTSGFFDIATSEGVASVQWTQPLTVGTWYQYVGTYDGTTVTAYLNGQPVGSAEASGPIIAGDYPVSIGYDPAYNGDYFPGFLADAAVVPKALSAVQVQSLWSGEPPTPPTPASTTTTADSGGSSTSSTNPAPAPTPPPVPPTPCSFVNAALASKAAGLWLLNDTTTSAKDYSGNNNTATIEAGAYNVTPGPVASCPSNGGVDLGGGRVQAPASLNPATTGTALTVIGSFQVPAGGSQTGSFAIVGNSDPELGGAGFALAIDLSSPSGTSTTVTSGSFWVGAAGGVGQAKWTQTLEPGQWYQYAGVYDGTTVSVYLNGALMGSATTSGAIRASGTNVVMGSGPTGQESPRLRGLLANVAVIPNALTADQIAGMWSASQ